MKYNLNKSTLNAIICATIDSYLTEKVGVPEELLDDRAFKTDLIDFVDRSLTDGEEFFMKLDALTDALEQNL